MNKEGDSAALPTVACGMERLAWLYNRMGGGIRKVVIHARGAATQYSHPTRHTSSIPPDQREEVAAESST